MKLQSSHW